MKTNYSLSFVVLVLLFITNVQTSSAQIRFGVKGGFDVASTKLEFNSLKVSNRLGYQVGPTVEFILPASGLGFEISALYGRKEYKEEDKLTDITISDYNYISVPVNIKQRIPLGASFGLFVTGGAYGNVKVDGGDLSIKDVENAAKEYKSKNFVLGLGAGAGISLLNRFDLGVYFRGDITKNYKDEVVDADILRNKKNQTWTVGLSYYF